ncbi:hypothetical protein DYB28_016039 [Aphanomyces astaci]|uniref:Uncharacterized protein n=1 Tax=Aphanomyces astaci TaxID=112090 RepID=A0A9X8DN49_APHAT|nr:hypothetical protein DYB28_016039 [Aphanomyces astaci]
MDLEWTWEVALYASVELSRYMNYERFYHHDIPLALHLSSTVLKAVVAMKDSATDAAAGGDGKRGGHDVSFCVDMDIDRDIDGLWFPARILVDHGDDTYDVEYDEDHKVEEHIPASELRYM